MSAVWNVERVNRLPVRETLLPLSLGNVERLRVVDQAELACGRDIADRVEVPAGFGDAEDVVRRIDARAL